MLTLHCLNNAKKQRIHTTVANVGRDPKCLIRIPEFDRSASRVHATLVQTNKGNWVIGDNYSTNGVKVNGEKITYSELKDGDIFQVGTVKFLAEINE